MSTTVQIGPTVTIVLTCEGCACRAQEGVLLVCTHRDRPVDRKVVGIVGQPTEGGVTPTWCPERGVREGSAQ